ncbi:MAG: YicC/YloC family endoribonuclease [Limnochordia bacterium]|nr:YicC family protein [Limnochordia bacterium]MDI9464811.1 YicC/YloC family endoribonuclease [Bacillota bacterium]NLO96075.1 YicC family protein [Bacillota bacterium]HOB39717.1 YicC family protein [Limnochordia bacterium]HOK31848.1 YicC family protein [Limnochordia bacterium]
MIKSMTGFGQGEATSERYAVRVELRSVNHRYLDLFLRVPKQYSQLEEVLRRAIGERIARGRVEAAVTVEEFAQKERNVQLNAPLLLGYLRALGAIQEVLGSDEEVTLSQVLTLPGILEVEEPECDWEELQGVLLEAAGQALTDLEQMRAAEGARLCRDLEEKITRIAELQRQVAEIAPQVVVDYRERLRERLRELLQGTTLTEERFLAEVALFADRCSIDEELVRLASHTQQLKDLLHSTEPVGRKLDFLIQEMNREVNTIGAKGSSAHIAGLVVELKSELEKVREQVQNIE